MTLGDRVTALLDAAGFAYAMIGAGALAASGVARSTFDLDYLTTDTRALDDALWIPLRSVATEVDVRRGDADDPLAGVVRASTAGERPVDLVVGRFAWQQRAVERARILSTGDRVVLPRDLVLLKLFAGGTQDLWDVQQLLDVAADPSLVSDVEADLQDLPASAEEMWRSLRARG